MTAAETFTTSVHIDADPERVFDYFTKPEAMLRWTGDYAVLDPQPGGQFTWTSTACRSADATLPLTGRTGC